MKIKSFTYTKKDGSTSNRVLSVIVEPNTMFEGVDITPLEPVDQALYAEAINEAKLAFDTVLAKINDDFELRNQYRRFDPKLMQNVVNH